LQREYDILRMMDHPFITDIVEAYYNEKVRVMSLVTPLYEGGEVMDQVIDEDKKRDEQCIARSVYQMLLALNYMHKQGVCHRDIKPQNIIYEQRKYGLKNSAIRLIDFGFAVS
jgi:serine/threonine protein kinase